MGKYTTVENPAADAAVERVLRTVTSCVVETLGEDFESLVLVGGYGRGEGGIHRIGQDFQLVNDLDFLLFTRLPVERAHALYATSLDSCCRKIVASGCGLKAIDLHLRSKSKLGLVTPNTVGHYEIAAGHQVIAGDHKISSALRCRDPRRLPLSEGTNYLRNRGSGLLIAALLLFHKEFAVRSDLQRHFDIELHKACQAMGDALLILRHEYHFSYRERLRRFRQLAAARAPGAVPPSLLALVLPWYERGVEQKLEPNFQSFSTEQRTRQWFDLRDAFGALFRWHESTRTGRSFATWEEYARAARTGRTPEPLLLRMRSWALAAKEGLTGTTGQLTPVSRYRESLSAMTLLLFSLQREGAVDTAGLELAGDWLRLGEVRNGWQGWADAVAAYLSRFYHNAFVLDIIGSVVTEANPAFQ